MAALTVLQLTMKASRSPAWLRRMKPRCVIWKGVRSCPRGKISAAVERWKVAEHRCRRRQLRHDPCDRQAQQIAPTTQGTNPDGTTQWRIPTRTTKRDVNDQKATEKRLKYYLPQDPQPACDPSGGQRVSSGSCQFPSIDQCATAAHLGEGKKRREKHQASPDRSRLPRHQGAAKKKASTTISPTPAHPRIEHAGCSICIGMNADVLPPHDRSAHTSNLAISKGRHRPRTPPHSRHRLWRSPPRNCRMEGGTEVEKGK